MHRDSIAVTATHQDEQALAAMIAHAFADLPPSRYLVPEDDQRKTVLARTFELDLQDARESGGPIRTLAGHEAVAVWAYHSGLPEPEPELDARLKKAAGAAAPRFAAFYTALDTRRRELLGDRAHWHLWILAVAPEHQGQGYASLLVRDQLARIDPIGEPTYLEAATKELCEVYRHLGFQNTGDPITLDDGCTRMYPMLHEPTHF
ncbi:GNAT family N-acetyltransferase [Actinospica sp. MGRD01-02]|uniref:GNAT family N-acetyltransferase n=1 Tax=Actinospica acidithermotolerans TaxID=2828514 RepID=A0A941E745_9ACTN|nr:GNAT family N-acetyltransferase [Actinospica acidithermotolerans]MBR7827570.1 GNAT family N-acetyltransferase [Actinospica acidithermotolerans]